MSGSDFWCHERPLILASQSATRLTLLQSAGLKPLTVAPDVDERALEADMVTHEPAALAGALAGAKAAEVSRRHQGHVVIGADQVLVLGDSLLHKPRDRKAAKAQLMALAAAPVHELVSAVAVFRDGQRLWADASVARLTMRMPGEAFLELYLDKVGDKALSSVGGYQIEGYGIQLFDKIEGDHSTILGLPLLPLLGFLRAAGFMMS
ncbi:MAG: Maf family protein [Hyphomicrobiales bacterium]|nr:Maf family protein [Hyphomicrobiales bacterium]